MAGHDLALFQHLCFSSYKWQQQDTVSSVLLCQPVWWQSSAVNTCPWGHSPALGVTRLPLESPMFPRSHPPALGQALPFPEPGELLCWLHIPAGAGPPGTAVLPARVPGNIPRDAVGSVSSPRPPPRCYCNLYL